ncbi:asparaginase [Rhodococcus triatomae]|uniref:Asparaginase n=1 Tax=Rhodococcus triatomae TaxID=300028 RepID=A0A1G8B3V5_9NOCA|nr:asparaginase [Rhodococcus triatomae]QNG17595.1 asparaginase [Rhodococcus triatomae]QNG22737.1 asparaginase [Rhodococcus triatomae]SDH27713.1 asparaginase [Rhodococcus triatomae]
MSVELVEVVRSGFRECVHRGSLVVLDPTGEPLFALGEVQTPIYPRSANKPWQAVTMLRHGFAPESPEELVLATASHEGESDHVELVLQLLARHGLSESDLRCPPALPANELAHAELLAAGELPRPVYMNCSGKHAAMLATCVVNGWPTNGYLEPTHPMQLAVTETFGDLVGEEELEYGIDGCGLPIVPLSLTRLAASFARLVLAAPETPERAVADAVREHPYLVSGTGKDDLLLMSTVPGLFTKSGAEGVLVGALPDGTSFAFKVEDGSERARLPLAAALVHRLGVEWATERHGAESTTELAALASRPVLGGGARVGTVRAVPGLF